MKTTYDKGVSRIATERRSSHVGSGRLAVLVALLAVGVLTPTWATEVTMDRAAGNRGASAAVAGPRPAEIVTKLPAAVAGWTRKGPARTVSPPAIFEYMDGAGELYLAYRLDRLEVVEYGSETAGDILVELYWMGGSDDAFGLLSGDWGGEPVDLRPNADGATSSWPRALYGSGLLRVWSDDLYARVFATRESEAAKGAVLALGRAIAEGRADPPLPRLSAALPPAVGTDLRLRQDRLCFFRSHLVLNSIYFLGQRDILDLGPTVEAVIAPYERRDAGPAGVRPTVVAVRYPTPDLARRALSHFRTAYLPEARAVGETDVVRIEDGWLGFKLVGRSLALVFEAPGREAAQALLSGATSGLERTEGSHE